MKKTNLDLLRERLEAATASLPDVQQKPAFASFGFFVTPQGTEKAEMFALAYRADERIGVKLTDRNDYDTLMSWPGTRTWTVHGDRPMSHWLLVPDDFHDDIRTLGLWVKKAHAQALLSVRNRGPTVSLGSSRRLAPRRRGSGGGLG